MKQFIAFLLIIFLAINTQQLVASERVPKGKLFIIGGGNRSDAMMDRLIDEASLREKGYVFILPMASESADSAIIWSGEQFIRNGIKKVTGFNFQAGELPGKQLLDSLQNASLIYICGGDQARFMKSVLGSPVFDAIHTAFWNGTVIAGTSAGAAVMSKKMITGNELRYPQYNETFKCIEDGNIEYADGLGLLKTAIIDQHFVKRSRYNRLITSVLENPDLPGIGIDESTAILVKGNTAEVVGESQVIVFRNKSKSTKRQGNKMGANHIQLEIYLPGEKFSISKSN
jgi:cyanophycinase